jgi:hypothetical protein
VPQLARELGEPESNVRRIADRLGGASIPRVHWLTRLIDADLAAKIKAEVERRRQGRQGVADAV